MSGYPSAGCLAGHDLVAGSNYKLPIMLPDAETCEVCFRFDPQGAIDPLLSPSDVIQLIWSVGDGLNIQRYANPDAFPPERVTRLFEVAFNDVLGLSRVGPAGQEPVVA